VERETRSFAFIPSQIISISLQPYLQEWLNWLTVEKDVSLHTVSNYSRDLGAYLTH